MGISVVSHSPAVSYTLSPPRQFASTNWCTFVCASPGYSGMYSQHANTRPHCRVQERGWTLPTSTFKDQSLNKKSITTQDLT